MLTLKQNMNAIYYKNLEMYAKKHKIIIKVPKTEVVVLSDTDQPPTNDVTETENQLNQYSEDDYVYKKPWNKLNIIHKCIKMQEFVNNLSLDDVVMKKHLKTELVNMIKNKKLTKKTDVEYDSVNGKIISVTSLKYKNNNYNIEV